LFLTASAWAVGADLRATTIDTSMEMEHRPDWEAASNAVIEETSADAVVLFDVVRPANRYRGPFYGSPRYIDDSRLIVSALEVISHPPDLSGNRSVAIVTLGDPVEVAGWSHSTIDLFNVYVPEEELRGVDGAVQAMMVMSEAHGPDVGATWGLAAAVLATFNNDRPSGCLIFVGVQQAADGSLMEQRVAAGYRTLKETAALCDRG
jgi:hypothetical protein